MTATAVLVTGASSGIGRAAVRSLARRGYVVFGGVRAQRDAESVAAVPGARPLHLDVTDGAAIERAAAQVNDSGFPLRGIVNNAGIAIGGPLEHLPLDLLRRQFEVNVMGAIAVTQAFLPLLRRTAGRVVFIGSIAGRLPVPYIGPYGASKAALRALAAALRVELAPTGVRVVLIEPASVRTPIWRKGREAAEGLRKGIGPAGRRVYGGIIEAMMDSTRREHDAGMDPARVIASIERALEARRPVAEMLVGAHARIASVVALLPPFVRDRMLELSLRLPSHE